MDYSEHLWRNWSHGWTMSCVAVRFFFHGLLPVWVDPPTRPPESVPDPPTDFHVIDMTALGGDRVGVATVF